LSTPTSLIPNPQSLIPETDLLEVFGARVHNLKNIDVSIPRNKLVVITGLSGSGKSSLAFDTIYAEGQRRYIESFSSYARQFLGTMERPDVDKITGLSPVISIEQKTTSRNPRSTVGTITEIYDFMRLLFARTAEPYSYVTGEKMVKYSEDDILELILKKFNGYRTVFLSPVVKGRKGHYRELFEEIRRKGFVKVRVDGEMFDLGKRISIDRYKTHDIEIVVDRVEVNAEAKQRIREAIQQAAKHGKDQLLVMDFDSGKVSRFSKALMCPVSGISYDEPAPNSFSFNSPYGACPTCNGLGTVSEVDVKKIISNPKKSIAGGGIDAIGALKNTWIFHQLDAIVHEYGYKLETPIEQLSEAAMNTILFGSENIIKVKNSDYASYAMTFEGIVNFIERQEREASSKTMQKWVGGFLNEKICPECKGARLKKESLWFKINNKNIAELSHLDILNLSGWFKNIETNLSERQNTIAHDVLKEIRTRLQFLLDVGLEYLALDRSTGSLSGGEAQRIRLATQIGSQLVGVLYILDEPSIGLHQRDNNKLIESLKRLRDSGNSVIVVEHDKEMIHAADHVIDVGPAAGIHGGQIVAFGNQEQLKGFDTLTSMYLKGTKNIEIPKERRKGNGKILSLKGASGNNLKNISVDFPLGKFICVTGVSGSGKSTLINETLYPVLSKYFFRSETVPLRYAKIEGIDNVDKVIEIDQSPIGRTPRSNPATYTGIFTDIRNLFVKIPEAQIRGYKPGRFSFNVKGGRCETCQGGGMKAIEMNFLPDVYVVCETCNGKRYNRETLEIRYKGKSINDVLNMTIDQGVEFFSGIPSIQHKLKSIQNVGLGYISVGQSSTTLSGGEAQRVKLATELLKRDTGNTFYILDEPTTGLHFEDVRILLEVLSKLVDKGNTVLVIEHNMDIIKVADHIIDLGPEGGEAGGRILCEGTPEEIADCKNSYTAGFVKKELNL